MQQILKRLELIKTSISLEDDIIINMQIDAIKLQEYDDGIGNILGSLSNHNFSKALSEIDAYLTKNTGLTVFEDPKIASLKLELKVLEHKLQDLTGQQNDCIIDVEDFNQEYNKQLGAVLKHILTLKKDILHQKVSIKAQRFQQKKEEYNTLKQEADAKKIEIDNIGAELQHLDEFSEDYDDLYEHYQTLKKELNKQEEELQEKRKVAKQAKSELDNDPVNKEYSEAKEDAESFEQEYNAVLKENINDLSKEQQIELKKAYRKASRLCHPDLVADNLKEQAHTIMAELNAAKKKKDLEKIKELLASLQTGLSFKVASDTVNNVKILEALISNHKAKIKQLKQDIADLMASETYTTIKQIENKNDYFTQLKEQLNEELTSLKLEFKQLKDTMTASQQV